MKPSLPLVALFALLSVSGQTQEIPAVTSPSATTPVLAWGRQFGTAADDFGSALAVEASGQCYIAGYTTGDLAATNAGKKDCFVAAFDPNGQQLWAVQFGSAEDDSANSVAIAHDGSLYIGGMTSGKLGSNQPGGSDVFVAKLDPRGRVLWLQQFGTVANERFGGLVCGGSGQVFLAGATEGQLGVQQAGGADAFLLKIDPGGTLSWACQWGSDTVDAAQGVALDPEGNLYVTGLTKGCLDGPASAGDLDLFISKIDRTGHLVWSRQFGTPQSEQGMSVRVDAARNLYVGGSSAGAFGGAQQGEGDAMLLKLSPTGDLLWKKQFGTPSWDGVHGVAFNSDAAPRVIIGGCQNWPNCQGFLREYDASGAETWSTKIPSDQPICGTQIGVDASGNIYQTGGTHGPAFGEYRGKDGDAILVKYIATPTPVAAIASAEEFVIAATNEISNPLIQP